MPTFTSRRAVLAAGALLPVMGAAAAARPAGPAPGDAAVAAAFDRMVQALGRGDLDAFYGAMHPRFIMLDEDIPWRLGKAAFQDHISFHTGGTWDQFAWVPLATTARAYGRTGVVAGQAMFRGKPRDAGFRLRPILFTQAWVETAGGWQLLNWHQSPVNGLITAASPG